MNVFASGELLRARYAVVRPLGTGGQSTVFLAEDLVSGQRRALKRLSADAPSEWLRHEFELIAQLDHPSIVHVHEFYDGEFFTMDFVPGADFITATIGADAAAVCQLGAQALSALAAVHNERLVHFDIKPENMLVHEGVVTIVDFGLAHRSRDLRTGFARGTLAYIAPELLRGEPADHRVDLFALGRTLYQTFTRTPLPERGDRPAPPLYRERPDLPSALCAWVDRLGAHDPDERFGSAQHALQALAQVEPSIQAPTPGAALSVLSPRLVGRQRELRHTLSAIRRAVTAKRAQLVLVSGGEGMGKSRFLGAVLSQCTRDLITAERATAMQAEALLTNAIPFAAPRVWLIDDAHRLSEAALHALSAQAQRCIVITVGDLPLSPALRALELEHGDHTVHVALASLERKEVEQLAASALGHALPAAWVTALLDSTAGSPLWIKQVLHEWIADGLLVSSDAGWRPLRHDAPQPERQQVTEHLRMRLANIDEQYWPLIFLAAMLGRDFTPARFVAAARLRDASLVALVPETMRTMAVHHMLQGSAEGVGFAHRSLYRALRALLPLTERREWHTLLAPLFVDDADARDFHLTRGVDEEVAVVAAEATGDRASAKFAFRRALKRYERGFERQPSAVLARKAAESAAGLEAQEVAIGWYIRAETLATNPQERALSTLGRAETLRQLCRYEEALVAVAQARTSSDRLDALRLQARLERHLGQYGAARAHYDAAAALMEVADAPARFRLQLDRAHLCRETGDLIGALREAHAAEPLVAGKSPAEHGRLFHLLGYLYAAQGQSFLALDYLLEARRLAHAGNAKRTQGLILRDLGILRRQQGRWADAEALLGQGERMLAASAASNLAADCIEERAMLRSKRGSYTEALAQLAEVLRVRRELRDPLGRAQAQVQLGRVHLMLGAPRLALHYAELATRLAESARAQTLLIEAGEVMLAAQVDLGLAEPAGFAALAERARQANAARVEAQVLCAWMERAPEAVAAARLRVLADTADLSEARVYAAWGQALCVEARQRPAALESAIALSEALGAVELSARVHSDAAHALLQLGRRDEASAHLAHAMEILRAVASGLPAAKRTGFLKVKWRLQLRDRFRASA